MQKTARSARRALAVNDSGHIIGQDHHNAKLTDHEIGLVLALRADGMTYDELAEKFDCHKQTIAAICQGRRRQQTATGQRPYREPRARPPRVNQRASRRPPARPHEFDAVCVGD